MIPSTLRFMMLTVLFLAAPNLATDLNPSSAQLLWILDINGFVMAGCLVAMGVLADRVGKRLLVVIGAVLFAVASIAAALTAEPSLMIVWRAVLGLAGAMMLPATLGLIFVLFSDVKQRGVAIGIWAGGISVGVSLGPLLSGLLLVGALIGLWFVIRPLRAKQPLLDVRSFRNCIVSGAVAVSLLSAAALDGGLPAA